MGVSKKYSVACGGRIKFLSALVLLILQSKINKTSALRKCSLAAQAGKRQKAFRTASYF
jgi:hypothetical protein